MNLLNKKILDKKIQSFTFPEGEDRQKIKEKLEKLEAFLKDDDLSKTKEKTIQGVFLTRIFEEILGYDSVASNVEEWHLIQHPKSEVDGQEADGSLGIFTKEKKETKAVIELKDAKTSLDKKQKGREKGYTPIEQAYLYATKFDKCKWIIVSNFREIRLYHKDRTQDYYEKFSVVDLNQESEFKKFYYLLSKENLISKEGDSNIDYLVSQTQEQQEDISKKFYEDYKAVRLSLYKHLEENNKEIDKTVLFQKSQKIMDRIVFILFCEDTANLLPREIFKETYGHGIRSRERSDQRVWREIKNLFMDIDEGRDDIDPSINGYNGGLFKPDEILDNLIIKDDIWEPIVKMADYDFESDLNVNILGHIHEQAISDIEQMKAEIQGEEVDKKKSKRKKDGIFYTPEYITKFIVENTVGKYLEEHPERLENIKILDPACGSGAFPNQAHSFLLNEYKIRHEQKVMEMESKGQAVDLFTYNPAENDRSILLNNLYGVDLNAESVEITKLALWLKTAKKNEPLQNLDKNIKAGNSLIDDPEVAGESAFDWQKEYAEIMNEGGFDCIIGNPPYVTLSLGKKQEKANRKEIDYYKEKYPHSLEYKGNTYALFIEKSINLLKEGGYLSFIIPDTLLLSSTYKKVRNLILENTEIKILLDIKYKVFDDAETGSTLVFVIKKIKPSLESKVEVAEIKQEISFLNTNLFHNKVLQKDYKKSSDGKLFTDIVGQKVVSKVQKESKRLGDIVQFYQGIITGDNKKYISNYKETDKHFPILKGRDIGRYSIEFDNNYVLFDPELLWSNTNEEFFKASEKLINRQTGDGLVASFDDKKYFSLDSTHVQVLKDVNYYLKYILAVFNSKLLNFVYHKFTQETGRTFAQVKTVTLKELPIYIASKNQQECFCKLVDGILELTEGLNEKLRKSLVLLQDEYKIEKLSTKLKTFYQLGWNEFIEELEKKKVKLTMSQKEDLREWFDKKKTELTKLESEINTLDKEIDQEVYKLYGLTEEEIKIVEN